MERDPLRLAWTTSPARISSPGCRLLVAGRSSPRRPRSRPGRHRPCRASAPRRCRCCGSRSSRLPSLRASRPSSCSRASRSSRRLSGSRSLRGLVLVPLVAAVFVARRPWPLHRHRSAARILARLRRAILDAVVVGTAVLPRGAQERPTSSPATRLPATAASSAMRSSRRCNRPASSRLALLYALFADWRLAVLVAALLDFRRPPLAGRRLGARLDAARARRIGGRRSRPDLRRPPAPGAGAAGPRHRPFERERLGRAMVDGTGPSQRQERRLALARRHRRAALPRTDPARAPRRRRLARRPAAGSARPGSPRVAAACGRGPHRRASNCALSRMASPYRAGAPAPRRDRRAASALQPAASGAAGRVAPPAGGPLVASGVSAYDPGERRPHLRRRPHLAFPAHVALVGDGDAGPRVLAALVGGLLEPSTGRLTYGGADLAAVDPAERAQPHRLCGRRHDPDPGLAARQSALRLPGRRDRPGRAASPRRRRSPASTA